MNAGDCGSEVIVAALCLAIVGGLSLELRRELRTFHAGEQARAPLVTVLTLGEKEAAEDSLSVRSKAQGEMGRFMMDEFIQMLKKEIDEKVR